MMHRRSLLLLLFAGLLVLVLTPQSRAIDFKSEGEFKVGLDESIDKELWLLADSAQFDGIMENDLFVLTQDAVFTGRFRYDLWCVSDVINFSGYVQEHARLIGAKTTQVSGQIDLNLIAVASTVMVNENAVIGGDICLLGEHVILEGAVGGSARLVGREATLGGNVNGDVRLIADDIVVLPGTVVEGNIRYTSSQELILDSQVMLKGELIRVEPDAEDMGDAEKAPFAQRLMLQVYLFLGASLAGLVWLSIFRAPTVRAVNQIRRSTWRCTLAGLIAFCIIPMLAMFALFTIIGIPLGLIAGAAYLILLYVAKIVTGIAIGSIMLRQFGAQPLAQAFGAMIVGLGILYLLASIQIIASTVWFVATIIGLGAIVLSVMMPAVPPAPPPLRQEQSEVPPPGTGPESE